MGWGILWVVGTHGFWLFLVAFVVVAVMFVSPLLVPAGGYLLGGGSPS